VLSQEVKTFNPSRLTLARRRRGLTKIQLAKLLRVTPRAVTAYEAGEYPPDLEAETRIVSVLGFPADFFYLDDVDCPDLDSGSFRSMSKMRAPQRDMALGQAALGVTFSDWLEQRFELPVSSLPDLSRESPQAAAESLRRAWALGELTIRNMVHLLESKGVRVFSLAVDAREVDAFSMWKGTTPFVFLNTVKTTEHSRFDAAHELGHLVLHKHGPPHGREAEIEANAFASAFLMPEGSVRANARRFPTYDSLVKLKKKWIVSVSALNYRLHELGLISDWHYRGNNIELTKRGREIEPESAPRETSAILPQLLTALRQDGVTRSRIADQLAIPQSELEQLLFGLTIAGLDGGGSRSQTSKADLRLVKG
jgi:Zn-dependent peptidase ImmA (M78 family)/DNA-binding XRE family transcriptional regulator